MLRVVGCFINQHDHGLVVLAGVICTLASFTAIQLLCHAQRSTAGLRYAWLSVATLAAGSGIWATHFIAMLAFSPGVVSGYDLTLTALSLVYALAFTGLGLGIAIWRRVPFAPLLGGALVGGGIAVMHYTGMAAFQVAGHVVWDPMLVVVSIMLGAAISAVALRTALGARTFRQQLAAALLLILAICSHHFTGMGAVTIVPDPTVGVASSVLPISWLAGAVAFVSFVILMFAGAALVVDIKEQRHALTEGNRLRSLANAAVEGLLVCCGDRIVSANESFAALVGSTAHDLSGQPLSRYVQSQSTLHGMASGPDAPVQGELTPLQGTKIPVELITRTVHYGNKPHYAVAVRDLRARQKAERQIEYLALHDGLTGLENRTSFNRRLEQEMQLADARGEKLAVLCLDLDRFKEVNDLFGHAAGDKLLQDVAHVVTEGLDGTQVMSRLGGDEFAILAPLSHAVAAGRLAERVIDWLRVANAGSAGPIIATSIGIAIYPDDAQDRTLLLNYADTALYRAKSEGRGTYRFFEARMGADVRERRLLEHDLRHAVARGQMEIVYQPQTTLGTGAVVGFEALIRWHHPERGLVLPSLFIPIAEESGIIVSLGEWVLRETCREAAAWGNPLSIAVNVSAVQIHAPHFARSLHDVLRETGLDAGRLELEITETALIRDPARALQTLQEIKRLGARIAMDDFGTGYSSLSNLRQFPFDKIKIDRSFIHAVGQNEQTAAIVRSVLGLGRGLGLSVLAEGVETLQELDFLRSENCTEVQGYYVGRPAPIATFAHHLGMSEATAAAA